MRRKRLLLSASLVLGFLACLLVGLIVAVKRVPEFYAQADMAPGAQRKNLSAEAKIQFSDITNALINDSPTWKVQLSADQLNAFFQEDIEKDGGAANLPEGISEPRVQFEGGRIRIGARYGKGLSSTVFSIEAKVWLVAGETNIVAMEVVSLRAGVLPLSTSTLLDMISQWARQQNIDLTWYREDGHPVAVMRFQSDLTRPTLMFEQIEVGNGSLIVRGRARDYLADQRKK